MRQRPIDVNQTTLFVDTQPRPVNRSGVPPPAGLRSGPGGHKHGGPGGGGPGGGGPGGGGDMTGSRAVSLAAVAVALLLAGSYLVRGHQYGHLHRRIQEAYLGFLEAWDREHYADFAASRWELEVRGLDRPLPLQPFTAPPAKRTLTLTRGAEQPPPLAFLVEPDAEGGGSSGGGSSGSGGVSPPASSRLTGFRLDRLLEELYPASAAVTAVPPLDRRVAEHKRLWRPLGPELRRGREVALRVTDGVTGAVSRVELGTVAFVRERTVAGGGEARCLYTEQGVWQEDATCSVLELLWSLCVRVVRNATSGAFAADTSGGGGGCGPGRGGEVATWRRLDQRRNRAHGRLYLPLTARNTTFVSVRHARDPLLLQADVAARLAPNVEYQILFRAVGLALCFLGAVLLLSVGAFAAPGVMQRLGRPGGWLLRGRGRADGEGARRGARGAGYED